MNYKPILIVTGEPNSIFLEIFFKSLKKIKIKSPLILITSEKLIKLQMAKLKFKKKIRLINKYNLKIQKLDNNYINIINVNYNVSKAFEKISSKSNNYIKKCFEVAFEIIKENKLKKLINGPINKTTFLNKNYLGITEFISSEFKIQKKAMLIFNKNLSVCPLTTHVPIKNISNQINKKNIIDKAGLIKLFYKKNFNIDPKIAVLGLNPHCESINKFNEDEKIIKPTINYLKKKKI